MVGAAKELGAALKKGVVGVIANTVSAAREIFEKLTGEKVLLIGRNRPWSAEALWKQYKHRIEASPIRVSEGLLYVVATQTVEVGANISFDALVSESAPIDALRQRFGRLNRLGLRPESNAIIVLRSKGDPIYGASTEAAWSFLKVHVPVDFGVIQMDRTLHGENLDPMVSRRSRAPLMFPGHLELWSQTNPPPVPDPDVAPFLHGPEALDAADIQIVWRKNLIEGEETEWAELVALCPPLQREALGLPINAVRAWLRRNELPVPDLEGVDLESSDDRKLPASRRVVSWTSKRASIVDAGSLRPGQTVIVPVSYGGADEYGWNPDAIPADIFDEINADDAARGLRKRVVRLDVLAYEHPELSPLIGGYRDYPDPELLAEILADLPLPLSGSARPDRSGRVLTWPISKYMGERQIEPPTEEFDETDDNSFTAGRTLAAHTQGVVEHARRYAAGCGLPAEFVSDIVLAARMHDWGKCDERFQSWLRGAPFDGTEFLAKSGTLRNPAENKRFRTRAGYPENARHEVASVMAACTAELLAKAHDRDLVLHLIGTHHGWGRPWFPSWETASDFRIIGEAEGHRFECSDGAELARVDSGWVDRFADLNRRYGYWGLAYLEAILRRADCMQSKEESLNART